MYKEAHDFHRIALPIFLVICLCLFLAGCGSSPLTGSVGHQKRTTVQGVYEMVDASNGSLSGALAMTIDYAGRIDVEQLRVFRSENHNETFGTHPTISFSNLTPLPDDSLSYSRDVNYTANQDLELDGSSTNLSVGSHYTVYRLFFDQENYLVLDVEIHAGNTGSSGGINSVVIKRTFKELR